MNIRYLIITLIVLVFCNCKKEIEGYSEGVVRVRLKGEPQMIHPALTTSAESRQVEWKVFMPLLQFEEKTMDVFPILAKERPVVETILNGPFTGGRRYHFELRETASWDDGTPVTAKDVLFSFQCLLHPEISHPGLRSFLGFIKSIDLDTINNKKFWVDTYPAFNLAEVVIGTMAIYPAHSYDPKNVLAAYPSSIFFASVRLNQLVAKDSSLYNYADFFKKQKNINGCGAYRIKAWERGERLRLERKKDWWANSIKIDHPSFKNEPQELVYEFVPSDATLMTMLRSGDLDVAGGIKPDVYGQMKKDEVLSKNYAFLNPFSSTYSFIALNTKHPFLKDKQTRRAMAHLMDVESFISVLLKNEAERLVGPILPSKPYYHQELSLLEFNVEKAKELLSNAGWEDVDQDGVLEKEVDGISQDFEIRFKYPSDNSLAEQIAIILTNNAIKAGIKIKMIPLEFSKLIEETRQRDFELYYGRWSQMPGLDDLYKIWHTSSDTELGYNRTGFGNALSDRIIDSINIELNIEKRNQLYYRIQEIIYEEQPYIFLYVPKERILVHQRFEAKASNIRPGYFEQTFLEKK